MSIEPLTKKETAWVSKLQKILSNPPSDRLGLYTIGDADLCVYDQTCIEDIQELVDTSDIDFCQAVEKCGAYFCSVSARMQILSTAG